MSEFVFIKDLGIYGNIVKSWDIIDDNGESHKNYIIKDMIGIEHEYLENEIEFVDNIDDSIKKATTNAPLEKIIELFNEIDKRYTLTIEVSKKKENCHSDVIVPYIFVKYGGTVYDSKEKKFFDNPCYIKDGKLFLPEEKNYIGKDDEYECAIWCYDTDVKSMIFELYMNIITRLK